MVLYWGIQALTKFVSPAIGVLSVVVLSLLYLGVIARFWYARTHSTSATAGEGTNSTATVQEFSEQIRQAYEKKDEDWIQKHTDTNEVPAEIVSESRQEMEWFFECDKLEVTSVEVLQFGDYTPKRPVPGEFKGRKLRFVAKPTHWVIVRGQCRTPPNFGWKAQIAVLQKDGHWSIAGFAYAD